MKKHPIVIVLLIILALFGLAGFFLWLEERN